MESASGRVQVWARVRPPIAQDHGPCTAVDCCESTKTAKLASFAHHSLIEPDT
ncbi:unnamed protein product [Symbiodinium necroappetens]|uniref:Uncharacterized protein n=1 Tax=Symbiodinium necroappetens TaxID=1628268 RepID=A0A812IU12_9DINO|nr:unnamed protein product [Symbiodinium necroappetens]